MDAYKRWLVAFAIASLVGGATGHFVDRCRSDIIHRLRTPSLEWQQ